LLFSDFITEIETKELFNKNDYIVAAVSGGADSVCLLHLLYRLRDMWNFNLSCAHINHGIRKEAEADASFVASLCQKWDIPFLLHKEDVMKKAKLEKKSLELVGREVRYTFLKSLGADVIVTAHNKNDVAESVLLHFIRGCGPEGLSGIIPKREDGICRPLLRFTRAEIEAYLCENNLSWCNDESNADTRYTRNKIRHEIIPLLLEVNPSFFDAVFKTADIIREENSYMQRMTDSLESVKSEGDVIFFSVEKLLSVPIALRRRAVRSVAESFADTNRILDLLLKANGTVQSLTNGKIAERENGKIAVYSRFKEEPLPVVLPEKGEITFGPYRIIVGENGVALPKKRYTVRSRRSGDLFAPEGMEGRKKVGDFFTDNKIPNRLRNQIPLFVYDGEIAMVGDLRRSRNFIPEDNNVLYIKLEHR